MSSNLSPHDQSILDRILKQELFLSSDSDAKQLKNRPLNATEKEAAKLELEAIAAVEKEGAHEKALELLNQAINLAPNYPSPYNNRAQILRLLNRVEEATSDLNRAIELSADEEFPIVRRQALAQRGWINFLDEQKMELAFADFEAAGKLGCEESKKMAVRCNPYARLCSSIMQEMLHKLYYSKPTET